MRIISWLLLLIISHVSFADTIAATKTPKTAYDFYWAGLGTIRIDSTDPKSACSLLPGKAHSVQPAVGYESSSFTDSICHVYYDGDYGTGTANFTFTTFVSGYSYTCPADYYHSSSDGAYSSDGSSCSSCKQSPKQNLTDLYLTGSTSGCYQECSFKFAATAEATATLAAGGQVFGSQIARCSSTNNAAGVSTSSCTGPMLTFSGSSCESSTSSAAAGASITVDETKAEIDMTDGSCPNGVSTGQFNGSRVIYCKAADSSGAESESDSDTETGSGGDSGSGSESEDEGSESGDNGGTSGGSSSSDNPDDPSTCDTEDAQADCAGTGSGGSFSTPAKGKDYFADLFGAADLQALADKKTAIQNSISAKKTEIKGVFNFTGISMSGSMSENAQEIKGASIDLSGKSTFDRFTYIAAILYFAAVIIAIWIILGGKK